MRPRGPLRTLSDEAVQRASICGFPFLYERRGTSAPLCALEELAQNGAGISLIPDAGNGAVRKL